MYVKLTGARTRHAHAPQAAALHIERVSRGLTGQHRGDVERQQEPVDSGVPLSAGIGTLGAGLNSVVPGRLAAQAALDLGPPNDYASSRGAPAAIVHDRG